MSHSAFLNDIRNIYQATRASNDGQLCAVAPHPDLRTRMVDAIRSMRETHGFDEAFVIKLAEPKAEGLNDGMIYPPDQFPLGTPPSTIRSAAADRTSAPTPAPARPPTRSTARPVRGENANIPRMWMLMTNPMTSSPESPCDMCRGVITMNARPAMTQNDYSPLTPPELGDWSPALSVSVVIPAHGGPQLELTLAALAAQTYPDHLMEVLVVDDGSEPPIRLPEIRPVNTRIVPVKTGWGISNAVNTGAKAADGEIIQRLDADMVACREHIEALARWHHVTDSLVTIGMTRFVEVPTLTAEQVFRAGHQAH